MLFHLFSDANELVNEIPIPSETTAEGTGLGKSAGKEDLVELDSSPTL